MLEGRLGPLVRRRQKQNTSKTHIDLVAILREADLNIGIVSGRTWVKGERCCFLKSELTAGRMPFL